MEELPLRSSPRDLDRISTPPRTRRRWIPIALWVLVPLLIFVPDLFGISATDITRDPAQLADHPAYFGMLSNLGVLAWCVSASVCLFTAAVLLPGQPFPDLRAFLTWSGLGSAFLMLDDLFLLHERVGPRYLGVGDEAFYAVYALVGAYLAVRHGRMVLTRTPYRALVLAMFAFAVSVLMDVHVIPGGTATEDHVKFVGVVALAHYFVATCARALAARRAGAA